MQLEQRSEIYKMYVTDSLFFLQHLLGGDREEEHPIFSLKYREILSAVNEPKKEDNADDIIDRMVKKSEDMTNGD